MTVPLTPSTSLSCSVGLAIADSICDSIGPIIFDIASSAEGSILIQGLPPAISLKVSPPMYMTLSMYTTLKDWPDSLMSIDIFGEEPL